MTLYKTWIDMNADVGERPSALIDGSEDQLLRLVSSANIACGGHAGDESSMRAVARLCLDHSVAIGAHPGYPDRAGFGREEIEMDAADLEKSIKEQVERLVAIATNLSTSVRHVKPHGALYNVAAKNPDLAATIARAVSRIDRRFILVGLAESVMLDVWRSAGFAVIGEAFVDRRYEADRSLRARAFSDSLITNPSEAAQQALSIARDGEILAIGGKRLAVKAQTLCVHSDTEGAATIASEIRRRLNDAGIGVRAR
jgi:UPF0271 protein